MSREDVETLRRLYTGWARGDFRTGGEAFDPEIEFSRIMDEVPGGPGGAGSWRGIDEAWQALTDPL